MSMNWLRKRETVEVKPKLNGGSEQVGGVGVSDVIGAEQEEGEGVVVPKVLPKADDAKKAQEKVKQADELMSKLNELVSKKEEESQPKMYLPLQPEITMVIQMLDYLCKHEIEQSKVLNEKLDKVIEVLERLDGHLVSGMNND